jgi:hypothetical protein
MKNEQVREALESALMTIQRALLDFLLLLALLDFYYCRCGRRWTSALKLFT